jgi:NAD(P)H-dependent FMN reductase
MGQGHLDLIPSIRIRNLIEGTLRMGKISIILGSTRQGRQGEKVARWVQLQAAKRSDFESELIDLRDWSLPFLDIPVSPATVKDGNYGSDLINRWANKIKESDGFLIVTPEYNHGYPAVLKNAFDWVYAEWNRKPVAFVAYSAGPISGARVVEQLREVTIELQLVPLRFDVLVPNVTKMFDHDGNVADESWNKRLNTVLDHLVWWTNLLREARMQTARA